MIAVPLGVVGWGFASKEEEPMVVGLMKPEDEGPFKFIRSSVFWFI